MENSIERAYLKLVDNLEELTKFYRSLLDMIRKEKEILISAELVQLEESNAHKDTLLMKIKLVDTLRAKHASEFAALIGANSDNPRLLEMAQVLGGVQGDKLRFIHSTLEVIIKRISVLNKENEDYAQSALETLNGAMNNIKDTLSGKKTYEKRGLVKQGPNQSGNFVSKEA